MKEKFKTLNKRERELVKKAKKLLSSNIHKGFSICLKKYYFYIAPDSTHYHQWFWDSCFHIILTSKITPYWAKKEFKTLISVQRKDGFIPHVIFWKIRPWDLFHPWWIKETNLRHRICYTAEIQPPVIGISLKAIMENTQDMQFVAENIEKIEKFYEFLEQKRDPDKDGLISIITPMESGMDMSPQYDIALRVESHNPKIVKKKITEMLKIYKHLAWDYKKVFVKEIFDVEDVAFNVIYYLGVEAIEEMYRKLKNSKKAKFYAQKKKRIKNQIINKFWDPKEKIFFSLWHHKGKEKFLKVKTVSSLFPLLLDIPERYISCLIQHLTNPKEFWTPYPVPSVAVNEPSFGPFTDTRFIWRGTTWINTNWFLLKGLKKHKKYKLYKHILGKSLELIHKHGFCEFYDPFTGKPGKAMKNFGWSTLIVDLLF